jgi:TonB family protein
MRHWPRAALSILTLVSLPLLSAPAPDNVMQARPGVRFDPERRCSEVRPAGPDDEVVAVVLFQVGATGVPSHASVKASSGSAELDAAAVGCVLKLRFQPATRMGDGTAVDSWQQMAWKRTRLAANRDAAGAALIPAAAAVPGAIAAPSASAALRGAAEVRVCVGADGKPAGEPTLTHSSGDAALDRSALEAARSGYRTAGGPPGCAQLSLRPEAH